MTLSSGTSVLTLALPSANGSTRRRRTASRSGLSLSIKHQLCVEQEAALSRQVSCRPLDGKNVELPKQASPLAGSCEGDDGIQVFLPFAGKAGALMGDNLTCGSEARAPWDQI